MLASTMPATSAPPEYEVVRRKLRSGLNRDLEELLSGADSEIEELRAEIDRLEGELIDVSVDYEESESLNNRISYAFALSERQIALETGTERKADLVLPDEVSTIGEAIEWAGLLPNIEIHEQAPVEIEKLETPVNAGAWAKTLWRGLRALDAYASGQYSVPGGFFEWCRDSPSPCVWPESNKKLAMRESDGVMNNQRLRSARLLPVDTTVDGSGRIEMVAHLKIAQGGGPLAPRVYFYDDTSGATKKVHVGYIGPHSNMPNLSTN
jgi:hypothetical protein